MPERPVDPDLVDVLEGREEDLLLRLNTALPARVQRYDHALQVVDAVPLVRAPVPRADGTHDVEDLPVVPSVPVVWPRVGAWGLSMALAEGDTGLLVCLESDLGTWRAGDGSVVAPVNLQRHHLSHAVFVPGLYVRSRPLARAATGTAAVVLGSDTTGARITLRTDGSLEIAQGDVVVARVAADGTIHLGASSASSFVALATLVDARLAAIRTAYNAHTHAVSGGATLVPAALLPAQDSVAATKAKAT
jgi:hypothetical protein